MEAVNGVSEGDKGGPPPPSPLTGCYLLIVIDEPHCTEHKDIILQRVAKGLLSWDVNDCLVDLEKELAIITEQALEGEEARYGERLIQFASENLVTEILIHPIVSTLAQCVRNLLSSFTRHRHIIHAGYTFAANGSWVLQDGTFSLADFSEAFQEIEVLRVIRAYENGISLDIHCAPEGDWNRLPKEPFTKSCKLRVNPNDVLTSGSPSITNFINYISPFLIPTDLENLLESSDVVGNIRFSRPTLYVFPGGQGDAALFGINGFNMLLDGGFSRKACFWDFVRHLDRLDAVLLTRLNNSNVNGISAVLKRKKQNAVYPQIGHFFCNIQERKAVLSPDGDKDKDPLLINLLEEGQEIVSNLRHLNLTPQVCYRDSEPINLYHKVGHGTLDMYVLSPAKDSKEVREFLQKWNNNDQKLFANQKNNREFTLPVQNLVSICALLVWQPANPEDTITRILFPGSSPQQKIFEGLDKIKNLEFIRHPVCSEKTIAPPPIIKARHIKDNMLDKILPIERKIALDNKREKLRQSEKILDNIVNENNLKNGQINGVQTDKTVKKSDSTESEKSYSKPKKIVENGDRKLKPKIETKLRSESQQRKPRTVDKKPSPTTPKKTIEKAKENDETKEVKPKLKASPSATPAKSAKDANNRKVIEAKAKIAPKREPPKVVEKKERKPISRRPKEAVKVVSSPSKKVNGIQKPDSIARRGKLDKEGTTDSSTVSTPSADQESVLKKDISKLTVDEIQQLKAQELADLKEEQEAVKEIEAVFMKGDHKSDKPSDLRQIKDISVDDKEEKEEYLIIEKTEIEEVSADDKDIREDETQKHARDSEESEKQRKLSNEIEKIEPVQSPKIAETEEKISTDMQNEEQKLATSISDPSKTKDENIEISKEVSVTSPEDKIDISSEKKTTDKDNEEEIKEVAQESQPDEKCSTNIESGATTTAPTLPEDERIPLDEIKEDNGDPMIEEKHVKEDTKEKNVPVIQLPPKTFENITKLPPVVGIRLDKQSHIRDIVKTPDEVADLPVHEEVDIDNYDEYANIQEQKVSEEKQDKEAIKEEVKHEVKEEINEVKIDGAKVEETVVVIKDEPNNLEKEKAVLSETKVEHIISDKIQLDEVKKEQIEEKEDIDHKTDSSKPADDKELKAEEGIETHKQIDEPKIEEKSVEVPKDTDKKDEIIKDVKVDDKKIELHDTKLEDLNKKELSKSPDEEKDKDEKETTVDSKPAQSEEVDEKQEIRELTKEPSPVLEKIDLEEKTLDKIQESEPVLEQTKGLKLDLKTEDKQSVVPNKEIDKVELKDADTKTDTLDKEIKPTDIAKDVILDLKDEKLAEDGDKKIDDDQKERTEADSISPKHEVIEKADLEIKEKKDELSPKKQIQDLDKTEDKLAESKIKVEEAYEDMGKDFEEQQFDEKTEDDLIERLEKTMEGESEKISPKSEEINKEIIKNVKEEMENIVTIDHKLQELKDKAEIERTQSIPDISTEIITVDHKADKIEHAESVVIPTDSTPETPTTDDKFPATFDEKMELGRKSPKEREEDVAKIVASVAEVLKSEAPLEEFEGKLPLSPYKSYTPFTTELRETHITTLDSPILEESKPIKSEESDHENTEKFCVKSSTIEFIEKERTLPTKISEEKEEDIATPPKEEEIEPKTESKINDLIKDSNELMQATSKMISEIKQAQESLDDDVSKDDPEGDSGIVHRMLVTASSEDGGEETEICPAGTITFSKSSESSGRSSPDNQSQKVSQKSSTVDTISDTITTVKTVHEDDKKEIKTDIMEDASKDSSDVISTEKPIRKGSVDKVSSDNKIVDDLRKDSVIEKTDSLGDKIICDKSSTEDKPEKIDEKTIVDKTDLVDKSEITDKDKKAEIKETDKIDTQLDKKIETKENVISKEQEKMSGDMKDKAKTDIKEELINGKSEPKQEIEGKIEDGKDAIGDKSSTTIPEKGDKIKDEIIESQIEKSSAIDLETSPKNMTPKEADLKEEKKVDSEKTDVKEVKLIETQVKIDSKEKTDVQEAKVVETQVDVDSKEKTDAKEAKVIETHVDFDSKEKTLDSEKSIDSTITKVEEKPVKPELTQKEAKDNIADTMKPLDEAKEVRSEICKDKVDTKDTQIPAAQKTAENKQLTESKLDSSKKIPEIDDAHEKYDLYNGLEDVGDMVVDVLTADRENECRLSSGRTTPDVKSGKASPNLVDEKKDGAEKVDVSEKKLSPEINETSMSSDISHFVEQIEDEIEEIVEKGVEEVMELAKGTKDAVASVIRRFSIKEDDVLEKSAHDIEENYEIVSDMSKSVVFEKCDKPALSHEDQLNQEKAEIFEKCHVSKSDKEIKSHSPDISKTTDKDVDKSEVKSDIEAKAVEKLEQSVTAGKHDEPIIDTITKEQETDKDLEKSTIESTLTEIITDAKAKASDMLEKTGHDIEENFNKLSEMSQSIIFDKCSSPTEEHKEKHITDALVSKTDSNKISEMSSGKTTPEVLSGKISPSLPVHDSFNELNETFKQVEHMLDESKLRKDKILETTTNGFKDSSFDEKEEKTDSIKREVTSEKDKDFTVSGIAHFVERVEEDVEDIVEKGAEDVKEFVKEIKDSVTSVLRRLSSKDEDILEKSAHDIEENYKIVSDMSKSIVFEKCDSLSGKTSPSDLDKDIDEVEAKIVESTKKSEVHSSVKESDISPKESSVIPETHDNKKSQEVNEKEVIKTSDEDKSAIEKDKQLTIATDEHKTPVAKVEETPTETVKEKEEKTVDGGHLTKTSLEIEQSTEKKLSISDVEISIQDDKSSSKLETGDKASSDTSKQLCDIKSTIVDDVKDTTKDTKDDLDKKQIDSMDSGIGVDDLHKHPTETLSSIETIHENHFGEKIEVIEEKRKDSISALPCDTKMKEDSVKTDLLEQKKSDSPTDKASSPEPKTITKTTDDTVSSSKKSSDFETPETKPKLEETTNIADKGKHEEKRKEKVEELKEKDCKISVTETVQVQVKDEIIAGPSTVSKDSSLSPALSSTEDLHLSGKSTPDIAEVEKIKEIQETLKHEKHIPGSSTPPTVPVSPVIKDVLSQNEETKTFTKAETVSESKKPFESAVVTNLKESELRSSTPGSDDYEIGVSTHSDISSGQVSRAPHLLESEHIESDDDDMPGSPMSVTSQVAHSRSSSHYDFEDEKITSKMDPMNMSFYGMLPDDPALKKESGQFLDESDVDFEKAIEEHRSARGEDLVMTEGTTTSYLYEITKAKYSTGAPEDYGNANIESTSFQEDQINKNGCAKDVSSLKKEDNVMMSSFIGSELPSSTASAADAKKDPIESWGKPLGLPSPAPPNDNKSTPKKERKLPANVTAKNKLNDDKRRSESPSKYRNKKLSPVYVDLTYVPHHGNAYYTYIDFFKRVRARYYVFSGTEPSREVYNALLEAKQTWDDKELEVTIIPTYDTDILGYWVAENEELLTKYKIDLSPSASRCTINLQDHETSCSAYRLEF